MNILKDEEKRSYPELEGKVIRYVSEVRDELVKIIGCDYDIGVTVVSVKDPEQYILCMHGILAPKFRNNPWDDADIEEYDELFRIFLNAVRYGLYDINSVRDFNCGGGASAETCSFGQ